MKCVQVVGLGGRGISRILRHLVFLSPSTSEYLQFLLFSFRRIKKPILHQPLNMQSRNLIAVFIVLLATMANADILIDVGKASTDFVTVVGKAKDGYIPIPIDCDVKTGPNVSARSSPRHSFAITNRYH